jgi:hypothetical protein
MPYISLCPAPTRPNQPVRGNPAAGVWRAQRTYGANRLDRKPANWDIFAAGPLVKAKLG